MKFKDAVAFYELGVPKPHSDKENLDRCKKRIKLNDAEAFFMLGSKYNQGKWGLQKNTNKAIELWNKAADLGSVCAHFSIGVAYNIGGEIEKNVRKSIRHWTLAAMGGHELARHNLGMIEKDYGTMNRA